MSNIEPQDLQSLDSLATKVAEEGVDTRAEANGRLTTSYMADPEPSRALTTYSVGDILTGITTFKPTGTTYDTFNHEFTSDLEDLRADFDAIKMQEDAVLNPYDTFLGRRSSTFGFAGGGSAGGSTAGAALGANGEGTVPGSNPEFVSIGGYEWRGPPKSPPAPYQEPDIVGMTEDLIFRATMFCLMAVEGGSIGPKAYTAANPHSSARGAYQYLGGKIWGNYGGYSQAHLAPKEVQDRRIYEDLTARWAKHKPSVRKIIHSHFYPAKAGQENFAPGGANGGHTLGTHANKCLTHWGQGMVW